MKSWKEFLGFVLAKFALAMAVMGIVFAFIGLDALANTNPCPPEQQIACAVVQYVLH